MLQRVLGSLGQGYRLFRGPNGFGPALQQQDFPGVILDRPFDILRPAVVPFDAAANVAQRIELVIAQTRNTAQWLRDGERLDSSTGTRSVLNELF
jgi:hypothetical protein